MMVILHVQAMLRAVRACGGNPLLLSPTGIATLREEEAPSMPGQVRLADCRFWCAGYELRCRMVHAV